MLNAYLVGALSVAFAIPYALLSKDAPPLVTLFTRFAPMVSACGWFRRYLRRTSVTLPYDLGFFLSIAWPVLIPIYAWRSGGWRTWRLVVLLFGLIIAPAFVVGFARAVVAQGAVHVAGCYFAKSSSYPARFRLDSTPVLVHGNPSGARRVTPILPDYVDSFYGVPGEWRIARDSVTVQWSLGFTGRTLHLAVRGDSLVGTSVAWSDAIPPGGFPEKPAAYARTPCTDRDH